MSLNALESSTIDLNNKSHDHFDNGHNIRRHNNECYRVQDTDSSETVDQRRDDKNFNNINIYRYKFTDDFTDELYKFSKIHQYDERKDFKEAWQKWLEENDELVGDEYKRLNDLGYEGDIIDKMFKSARYYFRKKSTEKKEPSKRRNYVAVQKTLIEAMDKHISDNLSELKPSEGFDKFCKEYIDVLREEVGILCRAGFTDHIEIKNKIKKTYKNRYFIITNKL